MANFIDPAKLEEFKLLQHEGKHLASIGDLKASLKKFELAKQIYPTPKVLQRIEKLKAYLKIDDPDKVQTLPHLSSTASITVDTVENSVNLKSAVANIENSKISNKTKTESKVLSDIQNIQVNQKIIEKKSNSLDLSPESQLKFKRLKNEAKELAYAGKYHEAVNCFKKALCIFDCPNVKRYIKEIESVQSSSIKDSATDDFKDQFEERKQSSESVEESIEQKSPLVQSSDIKDSTKDFKGQFEEQKQPLKSVEESVEQKLSLSDSKTDCDIEIKLAEIKLIYEEARDLAADGKLIEALKLLKEAQGIYETQKVKKRIDKLEELIAADHNDTEENKMIEITKGFSVYHEIYNKLYPYQREGVAWMWNLFKTGKGGVLGDDMGLGKTFQVIAFISGMIDADLLKHILIIMPVSLIKNWEKEFKKWCPGIAVYDFHSGTKKERERNKLKVQRKGHVLLTSYGMVVNNVELLTQMDDSQFVWDYVILDEGHKIKNPTKTTKAVYEIPAKNRLVLTGTPIQNNLKEFWSLYDFVHQGTLLGSLKTFKLQYENPITRSREKDSTAGEKKLGLQMAENLKALVNPYFLRRTKDEVRGSNDEDMKHLENQMENMKITQLTAKKNDMILWTYMSDQQIAIYQDFLHSDAVKSILVSKRSPLVELTTLKKICDHPRLLSQRACFHLGLNGDLQHAEELNLDDESTLASSIENVTDECLLKESGKLKLVIDLLEHLKETGHRTLVFSLSRKILDMIHRILTNKKWKVMRLDGTISKTIDREKRIMKFQRDSSYPVFLLTTQVGGVGITLTAADRVIIYDPSWNPATDAQAVDRAYRIGQQKDVVVYRLITCGTVEEKIYRRQIFKDSITRQATGVADPFRYFSKQELRELFSLDDPRYSATQVQLHEMHSSQRSTYDELEKHLEFLRSLNIFGISDHDLMFSKQVEDSTEDNDPYAISEQFIKAKVAAAHAQIQMEANVVAEGIRLAGTYNRPYQEPIPLPKKYSTKDFYKPPTLPDVVDLTEDAQIDTFPSTLKKGSFTSKRSYDHDDDDIQIISPKSKNGSMSVEEKHESPTEKKSDNIILKPNNFFPTTLSSKELNNYLYSENAMDCPDTRFKTTSENISFSNTEKLCKSDIHKSLLQDKDQAEELLENIYEDGMNLDETHVAAINKQSVEGGEPFLQDKDQAEELLEEIYEDDMNLGETHVTAINKQSIEGGEQITSSDIKNINISCDLKEKFQANLTHLMMDDIADLSFDEKAPAVSLKKGRKSCARQSTLIISESDSSCPNSASNSNMSLNFVDESEGIDSDSSDSSNSASAHFVPESASNTPQMSNYLKDNENMPHLMNKMTSGHLDPQVLSEQYSPISDFGTLKRIEGSVRRITPLKIDKNQVQEDSSFVQAMANSRIISPNTKNEQISVEIHASKDASSNEEEDDSPVKAFKKKAIRHLNSDSEESDIESHSRITNYSNHENPSHKEHIKSLSEEEQLYYKKNKYEKEHDGVHDLSNYSCDEQYQFENVNANKAKQDGLENLTNDKNKEQVGIKLISNHSDEEENYSEDDSSEDEDEERVLSNHSGGEHSLSESSTDTEGKDQSDLEQTFATCKDKAESNSEDDYSSNYSENSYSDSDESGSLFSEDD